MGWLVENGDFVEKDQEIAEIDSDKATLSISAEESGTIECLVDAGDMIDVGAVIASINTNGKGAAKPKKEVKEETQAKAKAKAEPKDEKKAKSPSIAHISPLAQ